MPSSPALLAAGRLVLLSRRGAAVPAGLLDALAQVPDPRDPRGRRYPLVPVLAVWVCAVLAGARPGGPAVKRAAGPARLCRRRPAASSGRGRRGREPAPAAAGYVTLEQLTQVTEADLARMHGIGPKAIARLCDALAAAGLGFPPRTEPGSGVLLPSRAVSSACLGAAQPIARVISACVLRGQRSSSAKARTVQIRTICVPRIC
jgi:hypothetical protein